MDDTGDVGLELDIVDEEKGAVLEELDVEIALVGALLAVGGIEAENAGGVGSFEANSLEGTVVGLVDADMDAFAVNGENDRTPLANHVLNEFIGAVGGAVEVVVAEVDGDIDALDGVG